ncbi:Flp family type IVb pilin [Sphingomonas sp.]|uniref:Flp family type IVb pilin n=1 Tax=Sphingomonas sp. TaxID=28214 RepID=UPI002ED90A25
MRPMKPLLARLLNCRRAATAVEYGLIIALIVLAMVAALTEFARTTTGMWNNISETVQGAH